MTTADALITNELGVWWTDTPSLPREKVGCIGATENPEHLSQAEELLRQQGCTIAIAPMEGNTWRTHRAVIESNGRPPFLLEPISHPSFEKFDYEILSQYSSSILNLEGDSPNLSRLKNRLSKQNVTIRPLDLNRYEEELQNIYTLCIQSFKNNFLYTPINATEFIAMHQEIAPLLSSECAFLAECEGQLVGFVFGYPDQKAFVVKTLAVLAEKRFSGLGTLLVETIQQSARERGFTQAIHALQYENNQSLRISKRFQATIFRRYALFSKKL